jgi:hypothetical protein
MWMNVKFPLHPALAAGLTSWFPSFHSTVTTGSQDFTRHHTAGTCQSFLFSLKICFMDIFFHFMHQFFFWGNTMADPWSDKLLATPSPALHWIWIYFQYQHGITMIHVFVIPIVMVLCHLSSISSIWFPARS